MARSLNILEPSNETALTSKPISQANIILMKLGPAPIDLATPVEPMHPRLKVFYILLEQQVFLAPPPLPRARSTEAHLDALEQRQSKTEKLLNKTVAYLGIISKSCRRTDDTMLPPPSPSD